MPKPEDTPLMQQWRDAKSRHPDALVFFRMGDFYELFFSDAEEGARLLKRARVRRQRREDPRRRRNRGNRLMRAVRLRKAARA